ncbi:MAG: ATP-dependent RNA helicase HrpA [Opitutaceae bacterium]
MKEDRSDRPRSSSQRQRDWTVHYPEELPVSARRQEIIAAIRKHPVLIVAGETGSGKTTQLPKMCLQAGGGRRGRIACTQPRRIAAQSVSRRVAEELKLEWGREVGCKIRFTDRTGPETVIKFLTDGMLLAELGSDRLLREYDTIIIDEAHERSLNIDFLLGHLNQLRKVRPDLRIVITSATIDTEKFSQAFDQAPIIEVSGRLYPVEIIHSPVDPTLEERGDFTHLDAVVAAVRQIELNGERGDILIFLPTERDIREVIDMLGNRNPPADLLPLFGRLGSADQQRVFDPSNRRKIVVATNVAETSLTIPGIRFVIDSGEARISRFSARNRTQRLPIEPISQSSANQRTGRCGRVANGTCIRLYSEADYLERPLYTPPEILRSNLAEVILRMKAFRLGDVETFPFIDPPPPAAIRAGYHLLEELGAIDSGRELTSIGRELARLPVDPTVGRMILQARREGVVAEVLVIASALSIQDPRERPAEARKEADEAHRRFTHPDSDFLTLLKIWDAYHDQADTLSQGRLRKFCRAHFISYLRMREWRDLHHQLARAIGPDRSVQSLRKPTQPAGPLDPSDLLWGGVTYRKIHRSLLTGLLGNVAQREASNDFRMAGDRRVLIFPGSTQHLKASRKPQAGRKPIKPSPAFWIMAAEVVETSRVYARTVARIDPEWIVDLGSHVCRTSHSEPAYEAAAGRVVVRETIRIHGLEIRRRSISYGKLDPAEATRIFITEALVNEQAHDDRHGILERNRPVREKAEVLQTRLQRWRGLDLDDAVRRFYAAAIGGETVSSWIELNRMIRHRGGADFLQLSESDLLGPAMDEIETGAFPDKVTLDNSALPLTYAYRPGEESDGVTLNLNPRQARQLQPGILDWLIPGHLEEKVHCLLRALPKDVRRSLIPIAEKSRRIARELKPTGTGLIETLATHLRTVYGIETVPGDWQADAIPGHLRIRISVTDEDGKPLAAHRDLRAVQDKLDREEKRIARSPAQPVRDAWGIAAARWERTDLETWDFPDPPESLVVTEMAGMPIHAWPGLRLEGGSVSLRLFRTREDARAMTPAGCARLVEHDLRYELAWVQRDLKDLARIGPLASTLAPLTALKAEAAENIRRHLCSALPDPFTGERYREIVARAKEACKGLVPRFVDQVQAILEARQHALTRKARHPGYEADVARLVPADFLLQTPYSRLRHLPRYLKAVVIRGEKAAQDPARDTSREADIRRLQARLDLLGSKAGAFPSIQTTLEEVRWMMEELRVSQFAQELGTDGKISTLRIERRLEAIETT